MTIKGSRLISQYTIDCDYPDCEMRVFAIDEEDLLTWDWVVKGDFLNGKHYCPKHSKETTEKKED